ncbi:MAG: TetR family transcriptional regulator [Saprospiraceae bacterium]
MSSPIELSTEDKIKQAAKELFLKHGFVGTKTRDIALAAGINLALLNYYFRSKEKLLHIIIIETLSALFDTLEIIIKDPETSFRKKVELMVDAYLNTLESQPEIPTFILNEVRRDPKILVESLKIKHRLEGSSFVFQWFEFANDNKIPPQYFIHILVNLMSLTAFPFVAKPMMSEIFTMQNEDFKIFIDQRRKWIPIWFDAIIQSFKHNYSE